MSTATPEHADTLVVGGGMAGLAAAFRLTQAEPERSLRLLEASHRLGGVVHTERTPEGFVIEHGPDSLLTEKRAVVRLIEALGLQDEVVGTSEAHRGAYVLHRDTLHPVPEGFALLAPGSWSGLARSRLLSWRGKLRAAMDLLLPRGPERDDESLASFVRRRFGEEVLWRLAAPLAGGIYGSDPERLSLAATMPRFLEMERRHRSVALGLARARARRTAANGPADRSGIRYGLFASLGSGLGRLPERLAEVLGSARLHTGQQVEWIEHDGKHWRVGLASGATWRCERLVLALPAPGSARLLRAVDPPLAEALEAIPHGSATVVTVGLRREALRRPLDAFGLVVPPTEARPVLASTWSSVKWPGRAPKGHELIRVFFGGPRGEEAVDWSEERLREEALRFLDGLLGLREEPVLLRIARHRSRMPRYEVGHLRRVEAIEALVSRHRNLFLVSNALRGVGIPDLCTQAERLAASVTAD